MSKAKYYWSEGTVDHFRFLSSHLTELELHQRITNFVELNCSVEEDEDEEDLVEDLFNQIYE